MEHAVLVTYDKLSGGAVPVYEKDDSSIPVWYLLSDGTFACHKSHSKRIVLPEYELFDSTADGLLEKFFKLLEDLVFTAGHGGFIQVAIRTDHVILGEKYTHVFQFGAALLGVIRDPEGPVLSYRSFAMDSSLPEYIDLGDKEEEFKQLLIVAEIMES